MFLAFTCKVCQTRNRKGFSRESYQQGVVLIRCDGCRNLHLIADNLGWFDGAKNVEEELARRGEALQRGSVQADVLEYSRAPAAAPQPPDRATLVEPAATPPGPVLDVAWDRRHSRPPLALANGGATVEWPAHAAAQGPSLAAHGLARLRDGSYSLDFVIERLAERPLGVGFALADAAGSGPLGGSWAYEAWDGAVVHRAEPLLRGLPALRAPATVRLELELGQRAGTAAFVVAGVRTPPIALPGGALLLPAASLRAPGQKLTLANLVRRDRPS